jgi:EF-hand domain pair/EF hand
MRSLPTAVAGLLVFLFAGAASAQDVGRFEQMFDRLDANHDGVITRAEFQAGRHARFLALDRNHDGYLSEADAPRLAGFALPRAGEMMAAVRRFDLDHDGRVGEAEFVRASMELFDEADANRDGVLTREEARTAAARMRAEGEPRR